MADVFISYAAEDRRLGAELAAQLARRGFSVWWDYELLGGERFREVIGRELEAARCAAVIWTPRSVASPFVQDEADLARRQDKLIPLMSDDLDRALIPLGFGQLHCLRLTALEQIVRTVNRFVCPRNGVAAPCSARLLRVARHIEIERGKKAAAKHAGAGPLPPPL